MSLYKVGCSYFVLDGHHRVSVAQFHGVEPLDACVREFRPKLPAAPVPEAGRVTATYP